MPGTIRAWPLFKTRSKDAPISLWWHPDSSRHVLGDIIIPGRIRQLYFSGTGEQSDQLFGTIESTLRSNTSSIWVHISPHSEQDTQDHLTRFLSSSFPKLSKLYIGNYQPDLSSPVFTTSNLTSLKLSFPHGTRPRYTLVQFSRILQRYLNLQELNLEDGAMPQVESEEALVPFTLPRLVNLELHGTLGCISGLINLIGSSPLRSVVLDFCLPHDQNVPALADAVKKIFTAYYECEGQDHLREAYYLTVFSGEDSNSLTLYTKPRFTSQPVLELRVSRANDFMKLFPLLPLKDTRHFIIEGADLSSNEYYAMFRMLRGVSRLHVYDLDIGPVLEALDPRNRGASKGATKILRRVADSRVDKPGRQPLPKLTSLTLSSLDFLDDAERDMLEVLQGRLDRKIGLKRLHIKCCRVQRAHDDAVGFKELVKRVKWSNVEVVGSDYDSSDEDPGSDESDDHSTDEFDE